MFYSSWALGNVWTLSSFGLSYVAGQVKEYLCGPVHASTIQNYFCTRSLPMQLKNCGTSILISHFWIHWLARLQALPTDWLFPQSLPPDWLFLQTLPCTWLFSVFKATTQFVVSSYPFKWLIVFKDPVTWLVASMRPSLPDWLYFADPYTWSVAKWWARWCGTAVRGRER
jgi:hypothetical protein